MKDIYVGKYRLGLHSEYVNLYLRDGYGGSFYPTGTETIDAPCIFIGKSYETFEGIIGTVLHEATEAAAVRHVCHYVPTNQSSNDTSMCLMVMRHDQFSEIIERAASFYSACSADLYKAWKECKRNAR